MKYEEFLFSQLFMNHINNKETGYKDLAYDIIYTEVLKHIEFFLKSNYNTDMQSEYDCIVNYLLNKV